MRCSKDSEKKTLQIFSKTERMCPVEGIHTHTQKKEGKNSRITSWRGDVEE